MSNIKLCAIFSVLFVAFNVDSQEVIANEIKAHETTFEIEQTGYCSVYQTEKSKGNIRNYTVELFDYDFNSLRSETFGLRKHTEVTDAASACGNVAIAFADKKKNQAYVKSFSLDGELNGSLELTACPFPNATLTPSEEGYIVVNTIQRHPTSIKKDFEIIGTDAELNELWRVTLSERNAVEIVKVMSNQYGTAVIYAASLSMNREKFKQFLVRIDNKGDIVFETQFAEKYYQIPSTIMLEDERTLVFGTYPEKNKTKPVGVFAYGYTNSGSLKDEAVFNIASEFEHQISALKVTDDVNMKYTAQFLMNDVIASDDGFYLVSETIRLRPSIGGIPEIDVPLRTCIGATGNVNTVFTMSDFFVVKLDKSLNYETFKVIKKAPNKVLVKGTVVNVNLYKDVVLAKNVSNYNFMMMNAANNPCIVFTERKRFSKEIKIGVVDLATNTVVLETETIQPEIDTFKHVEDFGILKGVDDAILVYIYNDKLGTITAYDLVMK